MVPYLLWSIVSDSLEAHGDVFSKGVRIVVTLLEIMARFTFCSISLTISKGSGDPGLDLAVLKWCNVVISTVKVINEYVISSFSNTLLYLYNTI